MPLGIKIHVEAETLNLVMGFCHHRLSSQLLPFSCFSPNDCWCVYHYIYAKML